MKASVYYVLLMYVLIFTGCTTTKVSTSANSAIFVTIPFDSYDAKAPFGFMRYEKFHVLLTNRSNKPVRVWQEWNYWGYYCLQIEIVEQNGTKHLLKKKPINWYNNAPV